MNRQEYFTQLADYIPYDGLVYVQRAYWLVKDAHRLQTRRLTGERYFEHVRRVSLAVAIMYGYNDAHHVTLGLLHDVIEDTFVPPSVIVNLFGQAMYNDVYILSKEFPAFNPITGKMVGRTKLDSAIYYRNLAEHSYSAPCRVKGCDRIDNLKDLSSWEQTRREKYITETRTFTLPVVRSADTRMADEIERLLVA